MDDPSKGNVAVAALFAALVEALDEHNKGFAQSFARHLEAAQARLSAGQSQPGVVETLARTRALLREDFDRNEPAYVVYKKRVPESEDVTLPSADKIPLPTLDDALRFWASLPDFDRESAAVETASGHRFDPAAVSILVKRLKEQPHAEGGL